MDRLVYTAASGLKAHMASQAAIANNIANVNTTGYRADRVVFDRLSVTGPGFEARVPASEQVIDADRKSGAMMQTGRPLDVAVSGDAWIAVQAPDGSEAYTRRGDLSVNASGVLETGDGHPVMGSGGPITLPPYQKVSIGSDGSVSFVPQGSTDGAAQVIDTIKLVSTKGTETAKGLDNLLYVKGGGVLPQDMEAQVTGGALEGSNVDMTQALVDMIENQRAYEVQANLLKEAKNMDESSASVMRMPS